MDARGGSRDRVMAALRRSTPPSAPPALPDVELGCGASGLASVERFRRSLELAGAELVEVGDEFELARRLASRAPIAGARRIVSSLPAVPGAELITQPSADPHGFADVDVAIARGEFAVAENGAIWLSDAHVAHRSLLFLTQHLVLVVAAAAIVADLHQAYHRIERADEAIEARAWRGFIAGPSKTADIEQALVVGAHGPRSLLVVLVGRELAQSPEKPASSS